MIGTQMGAGAVGVSRARSQGMERMTGYRRARMQLLRVVRQEGGRGQEFEMG